jgi:hypothetical protein
VVITARLATSLRTTDRDMAMTLCKFLFSCPLKFDFMTQQGEKKKMPAERFELSTPG